MSNNNNFVEYYSSEYNTISFILKKYFICWKIYTNNNKYLKELKNIKLQQIKKVEDFVHILQKQKNKLEFENRCKLDVNIKSSTYRFENKDIICEENKHRHFKVITEGNNNECVPSHELQVDNNESRKEIIKKGAHHNKQKNTLISEKSRNMRKQTCIALNEKKVSLSKHIDKQNESDVKKNKQEKKKQEKINQEILIEKEEKERKYKESLEKANTYYNLLLKRRALRNLKRILNKIQSAKMYYEINKLYKCFTYWKDYTKLKLLAQIKKNERIEKRNTLRFYFKRWKQDRKECIRNLQVAIDYYNLISLNHAFILWHQYTCEEYSRLSQYYTIAVLHYKRKLIQKCFKHWKCYPEALQLEKEKNDYKRKFHQSVQQIIPDFQPTNITD